MSCLHSLPGSFTRRLPQLVWLLAVFCLARPLCLLGQTTAFTYQGVLADESGALNGSFDLRCAIYAQLQGGTATAGPVTNSAVAVVNGHFLINLDFGAAPFSGAARWLELSVRTNGSGAFTVLAPRQALNSTPYAVRAANFSGNITAGQLPATVARLDTAQTFTAPVTFQNATGSFNGSFSGSGSTVTNVSWSTLNGGSGLSLQGGSVFLSGPAPSVNREPRGVAVADVNNDGRLDLISANGLDNNLSLLTNDGRGGFVVSSSPAVGANPRAVVAVDLNNDGRVDLATANFNGNSLSVLTNVGNGTMLAASTNSVGASPQSLAFADVNQDGRMDLISVDYGSNTVTILTNRGAGRFALARQIDVGVGPVFVAAADVNNDGRPDLITANTGPGTLTVLTNAGGNVFAVAASPSSGASPYSVVVADFNNDGRMDLASANYGSATLTILTNSVSAGYVFASGPAVGLSPLALIGADVNQDGRMDLITPNNTDNTLSVLTNAGAGQFALSVTVPVGTTPMALAAADLNRDGAIDLVCANMNDYNVRVLYNAPVPRFNTYITVAGNVTSSGQFVGNGAGLTNLNAAQLTVGFVPDARLSNNIARLGATNQVFTGTNSFARVGIGTNSPRESLHVIGNIIASGTINGASDRAVKQDFSPVDPAEILAKVTCLPITTWRYQADPQVRHLGPVAQDFHEAFQLGVDERHIAMVDADGVALAAIQGLAKRLETARAEQQSALKERDERIQSLEAELRELRLLLKARLIESVPAPDAR